MATRKIVFSLSESSIAAAIKELREYQKWVESKTEILMERLAMIGAKEASVRFASAIYDGDNDVVVDVERIPNGWKITASGEAVCFIEFGAGVYYNGSEPYPNPRPGGVSGIGEYGQGKGKQNTWGYYDSGNKLHLTHGNPAAMPMYYASVEIERAIRSIAREVFT